MASSLRLSNTIIALRNVRLVCPGAPGKPSPCGPGPAMLISSQVGEREDKSLKTLYCLGAAQRPPLGKAPLGLVVAMSDTS